MYLQGDIGGHEIYRNSGTDAAAILIDDVHPDGHKLMADNDPKHTSRHAKNFIAERGFNWWRTPAESPDLNPQPIENPLAQT